MYLIEPNITSVLDDLGLSMNSWNISMFVNKVVIVKVKNIGQVVRDGETRKNFKK